VLRLQLLVLLQPCTSLKRVPRRCRWLTLEAASNQLHPDNTAYLGGRDLIQYLFATAQASNITVIRTLAGSADDSDDFVLQTAPGKALFYHLLCVQGRGLTQVAQLCGIPSRASFAKAENNRLCPLGYMSTQFSDHVQSMPITAGVYNEVAFQGLDKIINDASEAGIKLILPFTDNWHFQDGLFQYVEWGHSM